ncbi:MAG: DNA polymerase III subunit beta [Candidatus Campbellbacteria bacterium]|nr:DNA polymerase III subunit beta [Candidatus Campbellbacteria bacterium]
MKILLQKEHLYNALVATERVTGKNLSLPVLRCVLLIAEKKELVVRATNLDIGVEVRVPADVSEEGTVAVPADTLFTLLSTLSYEGPLTLSLVDGSIVLSTPKSTTRVATLSHEDFPRLPKISDNHLFTIQAKDFVTGLKSVWWSASVSSIKPELSSIYLYQNGEHLVCVATDSFRLAEKKIKISKTEKLDSLLIPLKNVVEIIRHLENFSGDISVYGDVHQIGFTLGNTYITSRVVDGVFPDYKQIIPKTFETEMTLLKQDLADALKHVRIFSGQFNKLLVSINHTKKQCVVQTTNPESGESSVSLDAAITGPDITMSFNYAYILDALQTVATDSVTLQFAGVGKPTQIRSVGDQSFLYIVMPMNR